MPPVLLPVLTVVLLGSVLLDHVDMVGAAFGRRFDLLEERKKRVPQDPALQGNPNGPGKKPPSQQRL